MTENTWIGTYQILREVGRGGAGVVYEVVAEGGDRRLALKLLHATQTTPEALLRFGREAQLLAQVRHPSVVRVLDLKRTETGDPYIVTDLIPGEELAKQARGKPPPWEQSAKIVRELADALAVLHSKGILHRDLKPQNVIMHVEGHPVLLDFGLARDGESAEERLTQTGVFMGTPAYAAPEQAEGASQVGPQADVYGLGAILYFLLSGHAPYSGTSIGILTKLVQGTPPSWPSADDASVPLELEAVCKRAMRVDLSERTPSAEALRDELDAYLRGEGEVEHDAAQKATWILGVVAIGLLLAAVLLGWWALRSPTRAPTDEPPPAGPTDPELDTPPALVRSEPSAAELTEVKRLLTLAQARGALSGITPRELDLLYAVHYRNAHTALWTGVHQPQVHAEDAVRRLLWPTSHFTAQGEHLITTAGCLPDRSPADSLLWDALAGTQLKSLHSTMTGWKFNVVMPLPKDEEGDSVALIESVRRYTTYHVTSGPQGFDGDELKLRAFNASLDRMNGWSAAVDKPVSAAIDRPDGKEFALGTFLEQEGGSENLVLRVPYPLEKSDDPDFVPPASRYETVELKGGPIRALVYGPAPERDLWILGSDELYRWGAAGVQRVSTASAPWWSLVVDSSGRAYVGGRAGLSLFQPEAEEEYGTVVLDRIASIDGLALLDEGYLLAVGTAPDGRGAWVTLELSPEPYGEPKVVHSGTSSFAYASVSVSGEARRACFMRWDGEFEVWDLDALLPWTEDQPTGADPEAPTTSGSSLEKLDPETRRDVEQRTEEFKGKSTSEVSKLVDEQAPLRKAILERVTLRNTEEPLWKGTHARLQPDSELVPRACFLADGHLITFNGLLDTQGIAPPRRWDPATRTGAAVMDPGVGTIVRAFVADPRYPNEGILFLNLQNHPLRLDHDGLLAQEPPNVLSFSDSWSQAAREALGTQDKPVSVVRYTPDRSELLFGTTTDASPAGSYVLRVPLEAFSDKWYSEPESVPPETGKFGQAFREGAATLSPALPIETGVRAMAKGQADDVFVLGERTVLRWTGAAVEVLATAAEGERWRDLVAIQSSSAQAQQGNAQFLVVAGNQGLTLIRVGGASARLEGLPFSDVHALVVVPDFFRVPNPMQPELLEHSRILVAGGDSEVASWAVVGINGRSVEVYRQSPRSTQPSRAPYVSAGVSPRFDTVCLMRENGTFEVWDLNSIRLWVRPK